MLPLVFKSEANMWVFDGGTDTLTQVNGDTMPSAATAASIAGANEVEYNGAQIITVTGYNEFTYVMTAADNVDAALGTYAAQSGTTAVCYDSAHNAIWAANYTAGTVTKLNATNGALIGNYSCGASPQDICYDSTQDAIWVANYTANTVTKIAAATGTITGTYACSDNPTHVCFDSSNNRIWVLRYNEFNAQVFSALTGAHAGYAYVGKYAAAICYDSVNDRMAVSSREGVQLTIWNAAAITHVGYLALSNYAYGICYDSIGHLIWVTHSSAGSLTKVSTDTYTVVRSYTLSIALSRIAISTANNTLVATGSANVVYYLDAASGAYLGSVAVGVNPQGLCIYHAGKTVWVANNTGATISKLDTEQFSIGDATGTITALINDVTYSVRTLSRGADSIATCTIEVGGYVGATVPGLTYMDGSYYVMTSDGTIYGSDLEDPLHWNPLNFINAEVEGDGGVCINKFNNYVIAFGKWTTEVFLDAALDPPASPLKRVESAFMQCGCAAARTVVPLEGTIAWVAQTKEGVSGASAGRTVVFMNGFQPEKLSTPFVERIISADNLSGARAFGFKQNGHSFYVLTLPTSHVTLVFDFTSKVWSQWTSMTVQAAKQVTTLTLGTDGITVNAVLSGHGYADGDKVTIASSGQDGFNVSTNITYVDASHFTYVIDPTILVYGDELVPVLVPDGGTATATGYTESHFRLALHTSVDGVNYFLDEDNGTIYTMSESNYDDNGAYINFMIRTARHDAGTNNPKRLTRLDILGDKIAGKALVRYSKDDYVSYSNYRKVDLNLNRSYLSRLGMGRRVSFDVRVTDNVPVRLERLEVTFEGADRDSRGQLID